jgi:hypothetical protein
MAGQENDVMRSRRTGHLGLVVPPLVLASAALCAGGEDTVFRNGFEPSDFMVQTPDIVVAPGAIETWCYYFRMPNTDTRGITRWASTMAPGMQHLIVFTTPNEVQPDGTLTQSPCNLAPTGAIAAWNYAAHDPVEELRVPGDDGSGTPLAIEVAADQPAFVQMQVVNEGALPITTSAVLTAEFLASGVAFTRTATYLTVNTNLLIPPNAVGYTVQGTCATPDGARFWWLSTRTHRYATWSAIRDGGSPIVETTDWEDPSIATFSAPDFFTFGSAALTYECTYDNPTSFAISFGESELTDETCIGIGFFFPADSGARFCVNDTGPL